uniref:Psy2 n=1 Tax=Arundo donax TaxID=35708 RepID=A0A0A9HD27_ARUDO
MNLLHLSVTFPLKMSSSVRPACASSSIGRYILPLLASSPTSRSIFVS